MKQRRLAKPAPADELTATPPRSVARTVADDAPLRGHPPLSTFDLYERWAPNYPPVAHNPLMRAEQRAMLELWPNVRGQRALDLACGSGRYARLLAEQGAASVVALDFSPAMLRQVSAGSPVCASMMHLPFIDGAFNLVTSGLAVGHACDIKLWLTEVARVLSDDGVLLYSDFHPQAARAGMSRTFKDSTAHTYTLAHHHYSVAEQLEAISQADLAVESVKEVRAGLELQETFAGSAEFYGNWHGLPLVLVIRARRQRHATPAA